VAKIGFENLSAFILREKDLAEEDLLVLAQKVKKAADLAQTRLIINSSLSVAQKVQAFGLHLPFAAYVKRTVLKARDLGLMVGVSIHNWPEAQEATKAAPNYLLLGPIFPTSSKPGHPGVGLEFVKDIKKRLASPLWVIGGIKEENIQATIQAGADKVILRSSLMESADPNTLIQKLTKALARPED
jgi:thiamine-phosphate diphosphorylase